MKRKIATTSPSITYFPWWGYVIAAFLVFFTALEAYGPALHGPFAFDDLFLPYSQKWAPERSLLEWMGLRPLLGASFWLTFQLGGYNTFPYHVTNVLLHSISSVLVFFIVRRLLSGLTNGMETAGPRRSILAAFAAILFLLHPVQTESVAYIASRSEALSVMFFLAAFCLFLMRRTAGASWGVALGVIAFFGCALASKEHAVALPALLLLTDYYFNPGFRFDGIRANWRIYLPVAALAVLGSVMIWTYVSRDPMIGFHIQGISWWQYFFTECRALFLYLRLFLFPTGQSVDYDFPVSHTPFDHGAIYALGAILAISAVAWIYRRQAPLASYGWFAFLLLMAPTSSFIPIHDVFAERRLYLPFIALLLIVTEGLRRLRGIDDKKLIAALAVVCLAAGVQTWRRAHVWSSVIALWEDAAAKSPTKARAREGLGNAYFHARRCKEAAEEYEAAMRLSTPDYTLYYNVGAVFHCLNEPARAEEALLKSAALNPGASAYALLGQVQSEESRFAEALEALSHAQQLDPAYPLTYAYRGNVYLALGRRDEAQQNFNACLQLDPNNELARRGLQIIASSRRART